MNQQPEPPIGVLPAPLGNQTGYDDIDMETLIQEWGLAQEYTANYTKDFPQLDTLVDGAPITTQEKAPYVGDTTLAGLVRSIPRDSLQQLPIFAAKVNGTKNSVNAIIASYILRRGVFNEDTFGKGLLSTMQIGAEESLKHGYAPFMTATGQIYDDFGTTMRVLHYADVAPEPGIQDANESGCFYVIANLTKTRVRKIRDAAVNNENTSWDVEALDRLLEMQPTVNNYSIYQSDARTPRATDQSPTYQFVTKYDVGKQGRFVTFCPQIEDVPLRVIANKSKFGYPRVQFLVIDPAPLTPFGMSRVRLASPNQNLMNVYYQHIASMLILNSAPPIMKRGRFTKPVQLKKNAVWEAQDPSAKAELVTIDNGALQSFTQISQHMVMQIQNMMGMPIGNIGGGNNSLGFSKTGPGVKMAEKFQDASTNQITNILENFLRQYALVALDTYIAEQTIEDYDSEIPIEDTLILDDEATNALNRLVPDMVGEDNRIKLDWNKFYDEIEDLSVEIELSIAKDELEEKKRGDLQDMLTVLAQTADPNDMEAQQKIKELRDRLLEKTIPESKRLSSEVPTTPVPTTTPSGQAPVETQREDQVTMNQ